MGTHSSGSAGFKVASIMRATALTSSSSMAGQARGRVGQLSGARLPRCARRLAEALQHPPNQLEAVAVSGRAFYRSPRSRPCSDTTARCYGRSFYSAPLRQLHRKMQQGPVLADEPLQFITCDDQSTHTNRLQGTSELSFIVANSNRVCVDDRRGLRKARLLTGWLP